MKLQDLDDTAPPRADRAALAQVRSRGRHLRMRRQVTRAAAATLVVAAVVAGIATIAGRNESKPAISVEPTTTTTPAAACTQADLDARGAVRMPAPEVVTTRRTFDFGPRGNKVIADPPAPGSRPALTAVQAWNLSRRWKFLPRSPIAAYELLLAEVSPIGGGPHLAWLLVARHAPQATELAGPSGAPDPHAPPCTFIDGVLAFGGDPHGGISGESGRLRAP